MSFIISSVPFTVKVGTDLNDTQRAKFASDFEIPQISGSPSTGNLAIWDGDKLADGGSFPDTSGFITKKSGSFVDQIALFDSDGDIKNSGSTLASFVSTSDLVNVKEVYTSLGALGLGSEVFSSVDWKTNASKILTALISKGNGWLDIEAMIGSQLNAIADSIADTSTVDGGQMPNFNPRGGRFLVKSPNTNISKPALFQAFDTNHMGICTYDDGLNHKWIQMLADINVPADPDIARTKCVSLIGGDGDVEVYAQQIAGVVYLNGYIALTAGASVNRAIFTVPQTPLFPNPPALNIVSFAQGGETRMLRSGYVSGDNPNTFYLDRANSGASLYKGGINIAYPVQA